MIHFTQNYLSQSRELLLPSLEPQLLLLLSSPLLADEREVLHGSLLLIEWGSLSLVVSNF